MLSDVKAFIQKEDLYLEIGDHLDGSKYTFVIGRDSISDMAKKRGITATEDRVNIKDLADKCFEVLEKGLSDKK